MVTRILVIHHGEWHITIKKDGSGLIGHGDQIGVYFPAKTFDVQAIDRELQPHLSLKPKTQEDRLRIIGKCYGVTYYTKEKPKGTFYFTGGPTPVAKIFERFRIACRTVKPIPQKSSLAIEKAWREHPPTPISKPWDAEEKDATTLSKNKGKR